MKIFCLESDWEETNLKSRKSVGALFQYLEEVLESSQFHYIHRRVPTKESLCYYLDLFRRKKYSKYDVLYLGMHGSGGLLHFVGGEQISLEEMSELYAGAFKDVLVHFGSCSTLKVASERIETFKRNTGARYVSGYTKDVDFIESAMLEMGYLSWIDEYQKRGYLGERMRKEYSQLVKRLGFVFH